MSCGACRPILPLVEWTQSNVLLPNFTMSEYQYYYFESIDKPLTEQQQKELRKISTRAQINSRRFENEYHFGDLKADPENLLKKYFDVHLYYANWGTRIIMFKLPAKSVDFPLLKQYDNGETVRIAKSGSHVIVDITADCDEDDEWWEESQKISKYISFRDDLLAGDYRCLYIAWLAGGGKRKSPPMPSGMKKLSGTLRSFVDFMYLDEKKLSKALESAGGNEPVEPTLKEIKAWVTSLPDKDRQSVLIDLLQEKMAAQAIQRELRSRFLKERKAETPKAQKPCRKKP